ncbi:methyl-accepting chemotaxis protein, partial [Pseudomonas syringae]
GQERAERHLPVAPVEQRSRLTPAAAEQQSAVPEEIHRRELRVRDMADRSASATEQRAASTVELARLGSDLQSMVARFKI